MRDFLFKVFADSFFGTGMSVTAFSISHIAYLVLIFGATVVLALSIRKKDYDRRERTLRALVYAVVISYLSDFFFHDFVYGGMNMDKLPFHICTVLCPLACFAQFNHKGHKIIEPVAVLASLAPLMYIGYPASIGDGEPWCYQAVQTMFYHGALMAWGMLTLAYSKHRPSFQNCWKCAVLLVGITLWAKLGNIMLEHNWFFLNEDALYIGLVEGGIIPKWSLMIINPIIFFIAALGCYGVLRLTHKLEKKAPVAVQ